MAIKRRKPQKKYYTKQELKKLGYAPKDCTKYPPKLGCILEDKINNNEKEIFALRKEFYRLRKIYYKGNEDLEAWAKKNLDFNSNGLSWQELRDLLTEDLQEIIAEEQQLQAENSDLRIPFRRIYAKEAPYGKLGSGVLQSDLVFTYYGLRTPRGIPYTFPPSSPEYGEEPY